MVGICDGAVVCTSNSNPNPIPHQSFIAEVSRGNGKFLVGHLVKTGVIFM